MSFDDYVSVAESFDWEAHRKYLQPTRPRPMFDQAFAVLLKQQTDLSYSKNLKALFLEKFENWLLSSKLNNITGLGSFAYRDCIIGVTHSLDDLHIVFADKLVGFEKSYKYHRRIKPDFKLRNLDTLQTGDVLIFEAPFSWYGGLHPQTEDILNRCLELNIPVHIDAAWFGCTRNFNFNFDHPSIQTVSFSLSKGLGLGSHRMGVRYAKNRHCGPISITNDFNMEIASLMRLGISFMDRFGSDYLQNRYGEAYSIICKKLLLRPSNAIHLAFHEVKENIFEPVGLRPFLRYLVEKIDEFQ